MYTNRSSRRTIYISNLNNPNRNRPVKNAYNHIYGAIDMYTVNII